MTNHLFFNAVFNSCVGLFLRFLRPWSKVRPAMSIRIWIQVAFRNAEPRESETLSLSIAQTLSLFKISKSLFSPGVTSGHSSAANVHRRPPHPGRYCSSSVLQQWCGAGPAPAPAEMRKKILLTLLSSFVPTLIKTKLKNKSLNLNDFFSEVVGVLVNFYVEGLPVF